MPKLTGLIASETRATGRISTEKSLVRSGGPHDGCSHLASDHRSQPFIGVPYSTEAMRQDLHRLDLAWGVCQETRDRNGIYGYLTAVFEPRELVVGGGEDASTRAKGAATKVHERA